MNPESAGLLRRIAAAVAMPCAVCAAFAQPAAPGVRTQEIVIGSIMDLSGPAAPLGAQLRNGMAMRVDEVNEQGGIHGRRLRLLIEDSGFDPRRARLAAEKLVHREGIFAMVGHVGTATNLAALPLQLENNVPNFLPATYSEQMYEPFHRLKFSALPSLHEQMRIALPHLIRRTGSSRPCILYQDDEYGLEVRRGAEAGLREVHAAFAEVTSYKRGATDFSSQLARLKAATCDLVVLGTIVRETVGAIGEGRRIGFQPVYLGPAPIYTDLVHKLGGSAVEGLYATHTVVHPYPENASAPVRSWATKYRTRFGDDPSWVSLYGYESLEERVQARTREIATMQAELVAAARQAGKAEIANNVLHNVGNVLNSVLVSTGTLRRTVRNSRVTGLERAVGLMKDHERDLPAFLEGDARGRMLLQYLADLVSELKKERADSLEDIDRLARSVEHIAYVVANQQSNAGPSSVKEMARPDELLEEALRVKAEAIAGCGAEVVRLYEDLPALEIDRQRFLQVFVNLIGNAAQAMESSPPDSRRLTLETRVVRDPAGDRLRIAVQDRGEGIAPEDLGRLFAHGFTTRRKGHGFGLHSSALAAMEMGAKLSAHSDGRGLGAVFTLELPLDAKAAGS